ncbi:hypothetical protein [Jannaschia sp. R86511]|uniref:hypothetical protein n=1 Tax=Jannaschia sp. R86511 TaxID=3093853 RepID=UPI0036D36680
MTTASAPPLWQRFGAWLTGQVRRGTQTQLEPYQTLLYFGDVVAASVTRGRSGPQDIPAPATVSAVIAPERPPQPGDRFDLYISPVVASGLGVPTDQSVRAQVRFVGEITEVSTVVSHDLLLASLNLGGGDLVEVNRPLYEITAVDQRARINRWTQGDNPWPAEPINNRIGRILTSAGNDLTWDLPPDNIRVLARDVDNSSHGGLLDELSEWTGGVLVLERQLIWRWIPLSRRGAVGVDIDVAADQAVGPLTWTVEDGDKVTRARVTYGDDGDNDQPFVEVANEQAEVYGSEGRSNDRRPATVNTQLESEADARWVATELVSRRSLPQWRVSRLTIPVHQLIQRDTAQDRALVRQLLLARDECLVRLRGFPELPGLDRNEPGPRSNGLLWCLGMSETFDAHTWTVTLDLAPYEALADPIKWSEVDPAVTWDDVPPFLTWFGATTYQPREIETGTWRDVPSTTRWRTVPAGITWTSADQLTE